MGFHSAGKKDGNLFEKGGTLLSQGVGDSFAGGAKTAQKPNGSAFFERIGTLWLNRCFDP